MNHQTITKDTFWGPWARWSYQANYELILDTLRGLPATVNDDEDVGSVSKSIRSVLDMYGLRQLRSTWEYGDMDDFNKIVPLFVADMRRLGMTPCQMLD